MRPYSDVGRPPTCCNQLPKDMTEGKPAVFAVLDTNDFLEHRRFTEVPWPELVSASAVVLVVPWQVVSELDSNKTNNRSAAKRERARDLLPLMSIMLSCPAVPRCVLVSQCSSSPRMWRISAANMTSHPPVRIRSSLQVRLR